MPRSLASVVDDLVRANSTSRDAPSRFDLYDMERHIDRLATAIEEKNNTDDLEKEIENLSDNVEKLTETVAKLTEVVEVLSEKLGEKS